MRITGQAPCRDLTWLAERVAQGLYESMAGEARGVRSGARRCQGLR